MAKKSGRPSKDDVGASKGSRLREACINAVEDEGMLVFVEGHDDAILGVAERNGEVFIVYNMASVIRTLRRRDGMDKEGAVEFFEYNIAGSCGGADTPAFVRPL
jgi:hypothetical protein